MSNTRIFRDCLRVLTLWASRMLLLPEIYIILLCKILLLLLSFLSHFPFNLSDTAASFFLTFSWPLSLSLMLSGRGWSGAWRYGARWRGVLFSLLSYSLRMTGSFIDKYELQGLAALSLTNIKTHRTDVRNNWPQENGYETDRKDKWHKFLNIVFPVFHFYQL